MLRRDKLSLDFFSQEKMSDSSKENKAWLEVTKDPKEFQTPPKNHSFTGKGKNDLLRDTVRKALLYDQQGNKPKMMIKVEKGLIPLVHKDRSNLLKCGVAVWKMLRADEKLAGELIRNSFLEIRKLASGDLYQCHFMFPHPDEKDGTKWRAPLPMWREQDEKFIMNSVGKKIKEALEEYKGKWAKLEGFETAESELVCNKQGRLKKPEEIKQKTKSKLKKKKREAEPKDEEEETSDGEQKAGSQKKRQKTESETNPVSAPIAAAELNSKSEEGPAQPSAAGPVGVSAGVRYEAAATSVAIPGFPQASSSTTSQLELDENCVRRVIKFLQVCDFPVENTGNIIWEVVLCIISSYKRFPHLWLNEHKAWGPLCGRLGIPIGEKKLADVIPEIFEKIQKGSKGDKSGVLCPFVLPFLKGMLCNCRDAGDLLKGDIFHLQAAFPL